MAMYGVVALLDTDHDEAVRRIWSRLKRQVGLDGVWQTPVPHYTFHLAIKYDTPALYEDLKEFAAKTHPFVVHTTGLAIFTGPKPIVYTPIVRDSTLNQIHSQLYAIADKHSHEQNPHYHPNRWMPHITLAHGDLTLETLPKVITVLAEDPFLWAIRIDDIAIITDEGTEPGEALLKRWSFKD